MGQYAFGHVRAFGRDVPRPAFRRRVAIAGGRGRPGLPGPRPRVAIREDPQIRQPWLRWLVASGDTGALRAHCCAVADRDSAPVGLGRAGFVARECGTSTPVSGRQEPCPSCSRPFVRCGVYRATWIFDAAAEPVAVGRARSRRRAIAVAPVRPESRPPRARVATEVIDPAAALRLLRRPVRAEQHRCRGQTERRQASRSRARSGDRKRGGPKTSHQAGLNQARWRSEATLRRTDHLVTSMKRPGRVPGVYRRPPQAEISVGARAPSFWPSICASATRQAPGPAAPKQSARMSVWPQPPPGSPAWSAGPERCFWRVLCPKS